MVVLPVSWLLMPRQRRWLPFLLAATYVFYGWWDWKFVFLLAGSTVGNHLAAAAVHREARPRVRRGLLAPAVAGILARLGYFKFSGFLVGSAENVLTHL